MAKKPFSIDLLVDLVKHVPEGYLEWRQIHESFAVKKKKGSWQAISKEASQNHYRLCENCYLDRSYDYWDDDITWRLRGIGDMEDDVSQAKHLFFLAERRDVDRSAF